jgi:SAM-dependent methyltransferase
MGRQCSAPVESAGVTPRPGPRRLATGPGGRLGDLGQDYEHGHLAYVENLTPGGRLWLRTKPFSAPPNEELAQCLRTFAHLVELLQLGLRAQVLDVGCGPGWLSEFLARCGYWVTGIDISPDMTDIAQERVEAIVGPVGEGLEPVAEFHAMPVREIPWTSRFDAAVLYDTMHHFDDELETLETIRRALVPGGQLYIHEGVKPPPGSEGERHLVAEMERFGTLESPFEPEYLVSIVEQAGFVNVRRLVAVDELVDLAPPARRRDRILERFLPDRLRSRALGQAALRPELNIVHAFNPIPGDAAPGAEFLARIELDGGWEATNGELVLRLAVTNAGRAFWPAGRWFPYPQGSVTVGPYVVGPDGRRGRELARAALPRSLSPGETAGVELRLSREYAISGTIAVDLVREGLSWFSETGSEPLVLPPAAL